MTLTHVMMSKTAQHFWPYATHSIWY